MGEEEREGMCESGGGGGGGKWEGRKGEEGRLRGEERCVGGEEWRGR